MKIKHILDRGDFGLVGGVSHSPRSSHPPHQPRLRKWKPPPLGFVKLNVDASFNLVSGEAGLNTGVFRDSQGTFLGGFTGFQVSVSSAKHGELLAWLC